MSKNKNPFLFKDRIEKSVLWDHRSASLEIPIIDTHSMHKNILLLLGIVKAYLNLCSLHHIHFC